MPKQVDYPRASMKNCFVLADAVNELGGQCSTAMAADKLNKQSTSGAYKALVGAAVKYGLLINKKGQLVVTELYRDVKLAYDEKEAMKVTQKVFLSPPLFNAVFVRFENMPLPINHFEKLLIREFDVPEQLASRVSNYFLEGAKQCEMLGEGDVLSREKEVVGDVIESDADVSSGNVNQTIYAPAVTAGNAAPSNVRTNTEHVVEEGGKFSVRIKGPGMDTLLVINEEEDLLIVKAMLKKVERKLTIEGNFNDD